MRILSLSWILGIIFFYTKKIYVCLDQIKQRLNNVSRSALKKTFADLGDDDRDVSHQIQKPKIIP